MGGYIGGADISWTLCWFDRNLLTNAPGRDKVQRTNCVCFYWTANQIGL